MIGELGVEIHSGLKVSCVSSARNETFTRALTMAERLEVISTQVL